MSEVILTSEMPMEFIGKTERERVSLVISSITSLTMPGNTVIYFEFSNSTFMLSNV